MRIRSWFRKAALLASGAALLTASTCEGNIDEGGTVPSTTFRVSVKPFGEEATGGDSLNASISADGRFVAFESDATNLVPGDTNGFRDIFVKDRATGAIENLTLLTEIGEFEPRPHDCFNPHISADGRYVAFETRGQIGGGPLPGSVHATRNIYVKDRTVPGYAYIRVVDYMWPDADCNNPSISADGRYVAFETTSTNLEDALGTPFGNPGGNAQVYVADLSTTPPAVTLVSRGSASATTFANDYCQRSRISSDGNFVAFDTTANNLAALDPGTDFNSDIYVGTRTGAPCTLASVQTGGAVKAASFCQRPAISADGRYVVFHGSDSAGLVAGVTLDAVYVRDRTANTTVLAALEPGYTSFIIFAIDALGISDDGRIVSYSTNRIQGPYPGTFHRQIYVVDLATGVIQRASETPSGAQATRDCTEAVLSADGRWVAWATVAADLVVDDFNGLNDVYIRGPLR